MALFFQRLLDCLRHLQLTAAKFVGGMRTGKHAPGSEELIKRGVFTPRHWGLGRSQRGGFRTQSHGSLYNTSSAPFELTADVGCELEGIRAAVGCLHIGII